MATVSVRYIVHDVDAAIDFYCRRLGFREEMHPAPTFAILSHGDLRMLFSALVDADFLDPLELNATSHLGPRTAATVRLNPSSACTLPNVFVRPSASMRPVASPCASMPRLPSSSSRSSR